MSNNKDLKEKKRKKGITIVVFSFFAFLFLLIFFCGDSAESDFKYDYSQVGYYKNDVTKLRIFTFNVSGMQSSDSTYSYDLKKHGQLQSHTEGGVTYVFYYKGNAPDVTLSNNADAAWDKAMSVRPIGWVHILPSGKVLFNEGG